VVMKRPLFWDITPCSPLKVNRSFGKTFLLRRRRVPPKSLFPFNGLHRDISQKIGSYRYTVIHLYQNPSRKHSVLYFCVSVNTAKVLTHGFRTVESASTCFGTLIRVLCSDRHKMYCFKFEYIFKSIIQLKKKCLKFVENSQNFLVSGKYMSK
jgi:hypothetical protein